MLQQLCSYTFITVIIVDLLATSGDVTVTWTSPILPKLYSTDPDVNPLNRTITADEESWIASLLNIGALIGPLPIGYLSTKLGRKISLLCLAVPYIVSFGILAAVPNIYWYYFARVFAGISLGAGCSILPLYIAEIADDHNRGKLSVTLNIFWTFGNLIPYVVGPYLSIMSFNLSMACIPLVFFVLFLLLAPETPYFLLSQNKIEKAEDSLMKLRSRSRSSVGEEILKIRTLLKQDQSGNILDLVKTKANLKALLISLVLISFQNFSGIGPVLFYTQLIFQESGSDLPPEISSIIIGVVLFLSSLIIPFIADSLGRKVFLIVSSTGMMISQIIFGVYFYYQETLTVDITTFQWVPIVCLALFIISFNLGFGCIPWTISSELFSVNVKPYGSALVSFTCWLWGFILTKFFNDLSYAFGKAGTFWLFGGLCCAATIFTVFCVPETRGKSFKEIKAILES